MSNISIKPLFFKICPNSTWHMGLGSNNPDRGCLGEMIQNECCKWIQEVRVKTQYYLNWKWRTSWITLKDLFFSFKNLQYKVQLSWVLSWELFCCAQICKCVFKLALFWWVLFWFFFLFLVIKCLLENLEEEVSRAENSLLQAAASFPMYGRVHCITGALRKLALK